MLALKIKLLCQDQDPEFNQSVEIHFYTNTFLQINDTALIADSTFPTVKIPILTHR